MSDEFFKAVREFVDSALDAGIADEGINSAPVEESPDDNMEGRLSDVEEFLSGLSDTVNDNVDTMNKNLATYDENFDIVTRMMNETRERVNTLDAEAVSTFENQHKINSLVLEALTLQKERVDALEARLEKSIIQNNALVGRIEELENKTAERSEAVSKTDGVPVTITVGIENGLVTGTSLTTGEFIDYLNYSYGPKK